MERVVAAHQFDRFVSIAAQLSQDDVLTMAASGFRSLICVDWGEAETGARDNVAIMNLAHHVGLAFVSLPFGGLPISDEEIDIFEAALAHLEPPVIAYCRTGRRSVALWACARAAALGRAVVLRIAVEAGFELPCLPLLLNRRHVAIAVDGDPVVLISPAPATGQRARPCGRGATAKALAVWMAVSSKMARWWESRRVTQNGASCRDSNQRYNRRK